MINRIYRIIISAFLFLVGLFLDIPYKLIIFLISYFIIGYPVIKKAIRNICNGKIFDENFLMTVATIGAFFIGEFAEGLAVMLFYQVGELFQEYAVKNAKKSITSLIDIKPEYANVNINGVYERVSPKKVKVGDIIQIKPGEKVPLDGKILTGSSAVDTKVLTGESLPKDVYEGDNIISGCINLTGVLKVRVTKEYKESTVNKILELVSSATDKKAKSENFITKFSQVYTPIVVLVALLLAVVVPLILQQDFSTWIYRGLSFLVVSCPCALVISIPLSFFSAIGHASKMGVLIKGSNYLEKLASTKTFIFDKTGTLTEGKFKVVEISSNIKENDLLKYAAYAENFSNHPVALSIKEYYGKPIDEDKIINIEEIAGLGISAKVFDKNVLIGNANLLKNHNIVFQECDKVGTIVYVAIDKKFVGYMVISDTIKSTSKSAIERLNSMNLKKTIMLTGDREEVAKKVSKTLGIERYYANLLPQDKVSTLEIYLRNNNEPVVFVGDGINDAPSLAMADIGISMGAMGSDAAIEASDIVIMEDDLTKIPDTISLAKRTMKIVKENIIFAIFIKILILILTAFGLSNMWWAVFADVGVTVLAILNSLRLL